MKKIIGLLLVVMFVFSTKAFAGLTEITGALSTGNYALAISEANLVIADVSASLSDKGWAIYYKQVANYTSGGNVDNYNLLLDAKALNVPVNQMSGIYWFGGLSKWKTPAVAVAIWTEGIFTEGLDTLPIWSFKTCMIEKAIEYSLYGVGQKAPQSLLKKLFTDCPAEWQIQKKFYHLVEWKAISKAERLVIFTSIFEAIEVLDKDGNVIKDAVSYKVMVGDKVETLKTLLR